MSEKLQVLYFSAPWCGPCKAFGPAFNEVVAEFDNIDVQKINIDEDQNAARGYNVTSIPTVIMMKGSTIVWRQKGLITKNHLKDTIKLHTQNGNETNEDKGHIPEQTT
jgi:thioredoxin 1